MKERRREMRSAARQADPERGTRSPKVKRDEDDDDDKHKKSEKESYSFTEHAMAVGLGALIYIFIVRPFVSSYIGQSSFAAPSGDLLVMGIAPSGTSQMQFASCGKDLWCRTTVDSEKSCFAIVDSERPDEKFLRYKCSREGVAETDESQHQWISYAKDMDGSRWHIGLWRKKTNAIPFKFLPADGGFWHLQCKYPASGYDMWLSVDPVDKALILTKGAEKSSSFAFVAKEDKSSPGISSGKTASTSPQEEKSSLPPPPATTKEETKSATKEELSLEFDYKGCYEDTFDRDLPHPPSDRGKPEYGGRHQGYDVSSCGKACRSRGYKYFSLQAYTTERKSFCFCGDSYGTKGHRKVTDGECGPTNECGLGPCGRGRRNAVYGFL